MTDAAQLCLNAYRAELYRVETNHTADKALTASVGILAAAIAGTGMKYDVVLARGEEELRLLEAEEG